MTIKELLDNCPETSDVFFSRKMACVGCPAEEFGTVKNAARYYHINLKDLISELKIAVANRGKI